MKISFILATARPSRIKQVLQAWKSKMPKPQQHEWIVVTDEPHECATHINIGRRDCVTAWNFGASNSSGDLIMAISDDTEPETKCIDRKLIEASQPYVDKPTLFLVGDSRIQRIKRFGSNVKRYKDLIPAYHPVINRCGYSTFGYLFHPDYESMFCDDHITALYDARGVVVDLIFKVVVNHKWVSSPNDPIGRSHYSQDRLNRGQELYWKHIKELYGC